MWRMGDESGSSSENPSSSLSVSVKKLALKLESWEQWACDWWDGRLKEGGGLGM